MRFCSFISSNHVGALNTNVCRIAGGSFSHMPGPSATVSTNCCAPSSVLPDCRVAMTPAIRC